MTGPPPERAAQCPVCGFPVDRPRTTCAECGWETTADDAELLAGEQRKRDLTAAVRAAGDPRRPSFQESFQALAQLARGEPPSPADATMIAPPPPRGASDRTPDAALAEALDDLAGGGVRTVSLIGIGTDGIAEVRIAPGADGVPRLSEERVWRWSIAWRWATESSRPLPPTRQSFQLAGGVGDGQPFPVESVLDDLARFIKRPGRAGARTVVINRVAGWPIPELAAARVLRYCRGAVVSRAPGPGPVAQATPETGPGNLVTFARRVLEHTPLRYPYGLVVAELSHSSDRVRQVRVAFDELFAAQTQLNTGTHLARTRRVSAGTSRPGTVTLAVVARRGPEPPDWDVLAQRPVDLRSGEVAEVRVEVHGPNDVRIVAPPPAGRPGLRWEQALAAVPSYIESVVTRPVDVAFAVELAGTQQRVNARLNLVDAVLMLAAERFPDPEALRVHMVGYLDHPNVDSYVAERTGRDARILSSSPFGPLTAAAEELRRWRAIRPFPGVVNSYQAAPLEDALTLVADSAWRPAATPSLVVVGSRPPHPVSAGLAANAGGQIAPCPFGRDWSDALDRLAGLDGLRRVAVWDPPAWARPSSDDPYAPSAREFWENSLADTLLGLVNADPEKVAAQAGLLPPGESRSLPFPVLAPSARRAGPG